MELLQSNEPEIALSHTHEPLAPRGWKAQLMQKNKTPTTYNSVSRKQQTIHKTFLVLNAARKIKSTYHRFLAFDVPSVDVMCQLQSVFLLICNFLQFSPPANFHILFCHIRGNIGASNAK